MLGYAGAYLSSGWPPANINDGSVYPAQSAILANGPWSFSIDYVDSSAQLTSHGFGAAINQIDSGTVPISLSLCSPFCESSPFTWNGPITLDSIAVELKGAEPVADVPEASTWAMLLIGFAGLGTLAGARRRKRDTSEKGPFAPLPPSP